MQAQSQQSAQAAAEAQRQAAGATQVATNAATQAVAQAHQQAQQAPGKSSTFDPKSSQTDESKFNSWGCKFTNFMESLNSSGKALNEMGI